MARIRTIKPDIRNSESMGRVSRDARLLFMLLFTEVDDAGRCRAASRMLASVLYPYDDDAKDLIDDWLDELETEACIRRYQVDGSRYLEITNWLKHQKIDHPSQSKLPGPSDMFATPREDFANPRASRARAGKGKGSGREGDLEGEEEKDKTALSRARAPDDWPADYWQQFEAVYPNRIGMAAARKALEKARADGLVTWAFFMAALREYAAKTDDRAWLGPKRWIEEERYNDRPAPKPAGNGRARPSNADVAAQLAREAEERERSQGHAAGPSDGIGGPEIGGDDARCVSGNG